MNVSNLNITQQQEPATTKSITPCAQDAASPIVENLRNFVTDLALVKCDEMYQAAKKKSADISASKAMKSAVKTGMLKDIGQQLVMDLVNFLVEPCSLKEVVPAKAHNNSDIKIKLDDLRTADFLILVAGSTCRDWNLGCAWLSNTFCCLL